MYWICPVSRETVRSPAEPIKVELNRMEWRVWKLEHRTSISAVILWAAWRSRSRRSKILILSPGSRVELTVQFYRKCWTSFDRTVVVIVMMQLLILCM